MSESAWKGYGNGFDTRFNDTMELIDPDLPTVMETILSSDAITVSEALHTVTMDNPLNLQPSERDRYRLMLGRLMLDMYIDAGFDPYDQCTLEMVRMPGKTKCCNPYSDNMYRHLIEKTVIEREDGKFRFVFG
ncbi:MAG: hypothetical protein ACI381_06590 [Candidatus Methanomethylophilaceae archaeon]